MTSEAGSGAEATAARRGGVPGRARDLIEHVVGPRDCGDALRGVAASLRESADGLHTRPLPYDPGTLETCAALVRRGARLRALYPQAALGRPEAAAWLWRSADAGVEIRIVDHVAHDMLILDGHTVCLPNGEPRAPAMLRISRSMLVGSFQSIYETYWERATPLAPARPPARRSGSAAGPGSGSATGPALREPAVIRLMQQGLDDRAIAAELGVGARAVADAIAALMQRLDAATRFELGFKLALEPEPLDALDAFDAMGPLDAFDALDAMGPLDGVDPLERRDARGRFTGFDASDAWDRPEP